MLICHFCQAQFCIFDEKRKNTFIASGKNKDFDISCLKYRGTVAKRRG